MDKTLKQFAFDFAEGEIISAIQKQELGNNFNLAFKAIPSIMLDDYTPYIKTKTRALHAFQIKLMQKAEPANSIMDFGDRDGTHLTYYEKLVCQNKTPILLKIRDKLSAYHNINSLSLNIDKESIERIRQNFLPALELDFNKMEGKNFGFEPDLIFCFETLEHLENPIGFLKNLPECKNLIITVPYLEKSRIWLNEDESVHGHIFELCPTDWKKIFKRAGWEVRHEEIFLQYTNLLGKMFFKKYDFEGFYGVILRRRT